MKRKIFSILFAVVLVFSFTLATAVPAGAGTLTVNTSLADTPPNYHTIQAAVDAAGTGDTILVAAGTYEESVRITTDDITLKTEAGAILDGTNVLGNNAVGNAIYLISVSGVTVQGFDIRHYNGGGLHGGSSSIYLVAATNNVIKENIISDSVEGIVLWFVNSGNTVEYNEISASSVGIRLYYESDHNVIRNNETSGTFGRGITLSSHPSNGFPSDNIIADNVISTNGGYGLHVDGADSSGNVFRGNDISGTFSDGIALWASNNIAERNVISGGAKGIYISANDTVVRWNEIDGSGTQGIYLQGSGNLVQGNDISAGRVNGIFLFYNDNNVVEWNEISGAGSGILVQGRSGDRKPNDNVIRWNTVSGSGQYGIRLIGGASSNLIKENTVTGSGNYDLFHDAWSTPNCWEDNTYVTWSGADISLFAEGCGAMVLEKEITSGPHVDGDGNIDVVVEVGQASTTKYDFTITYSGPEEVLIVDTVPAEWVVTEVAGDAIVDGSSDGPQLDGNGGTVDVFPAGRGNPSKSATKIEWRPASASSSLLVGVETRESPGKKNTKFAPTSCGALYLNEDGAAAYEVDENGEPLRDPETGEKLPPILVSEPLLLAAVEDFNGDGVIARDGNGDEDGDGLNDLEEVSGEVVTDPCLADTDGDGLTDDAELAGPTDALNPDTDGDSVLDGQDADPLNPDAH